MIEKWDGARVDSGFCPACGPVRGQTAGQRIHIGIPLVADFRANQEQRR